MPNLRKFSFDEEQGLDQKPSWVAWDPVSLRGKCIRCGNVLFANNQESSDQAMDRHAMAHRGCALDKEKQEKQIYVIEPNTWKEQSQASLPAGRIQVLNFIGGSSLTSTYHSGTSYSDSGLTVDAGNRFIIQMCTAISFVGRIVDLYIKAPDYIGTIELVIGDMIQFDGPIEMLNRYKGAAMRNAKCALRPGVPCILKGVNKTLSPMLISEAALVMEIDPEWEKAQYQYRDL